jgi:hypothetical protein
LKSAHHREMRTLLLAFTLGLAACSSQSGKGPVLASSTGQSAYAVHYVDDLAAMTKAVSDAQTQEKTLSAGFAGKVDELKKPDWDKVLLVIDDSDQAGKSADFAEAHGEADTVKGFWDSEKDTINGRVAGSAQHTIKEAGCAADEQKISGTIVYAMNDAVNKQLQKRLRGRNEAFLVLERYKVGLGPENVSKLEKLADDVSQASYDVHVLMVEQRENLQRMLGDKDSVKKTLDRYMKEETDFQTETGRTDGERKASQDRLSAASKAKADIDNAAQQAEAQSKQMEQSIDAATKDYEEALKALRAKVAEKKKAG